MIAPLPRQHIRRRRSVLRLRSRRPHPAVRQRFTLQQRPRRPARGAERPRRARRFRGTCGTRRLWKPLGIGSALARLLAAAAKKRALLGAVAAGLLVLGGAAVAIVAVSRRVVAVVDFPDESQAEKDLYSLLVPEEPASSEDLAGSGTLKTLRVGAYTVAKGDTISVIAQKQGRTLDTILSWNDIRDVRSLQPGTVLGIPNADGLKYKVRRGDTLEGIARRTGVALERILDFNSLSSSMIRSGDVLFLPGAHMPANDIARVLGNLFIYPLRGKLTSPFGIRESPITGVRTFHYGVDLRANVGTAVGAAMAGKVIDAGVNGTFGNYVILSHGGSYQTLYGHLNKIYVDEGARVSQGEKIAESGNTGQSTGPHLHFAIYRNGQPVDPLGYLR